MPPEPPTAGETAASLRCFVALLPDAAARDALATLRDRLHARLQARWIRARPVVPLNFHLTLAFIGALALDRAQRLAAALAALPAAARSPPWLIDRSGAFADAGVAWAGSTTAAPALAALAQQVRAQLDQRQIAFDRRPFVAHVTLLRGLPPTGVDLIAQAVLPAIAWPLRAPVLLASHTTPDGLRYLPVAPAAAR